jgi:hypothetical protein
MLGVICLYKVKRLVDSVQIVYHRHHSGPLSTEACVFYLLSPLKLIGLGCFLITLSSDISPLSSVTLDLFCLLQQLSHCRPMQINSIWFDWWNFWQTDWQGAGTLHRKCDKTSQQVWGLTKLRLTQIPHKPDFMEWHCSLCLLLKPFLRRSPGSSTSNCHHHMSSRNRGSSWLDCMSIVFCYDCCLC